MTALTSEQVEQFRREGYLLVEDMFDPAADIDPIIGEYHGVLERLVIQAKERGIAVVDRRGPLGTNPKHHARTSGEAVAA